MSSIFNFLWPINFLFIIFAINQYNIYKKTVLKNKEKYITKSYVLYNFSIFLCLILILFTLTSVIASIDYITQGESLTNLLLLCFCAVTSILSFLFLIYPFIIMFIYKDYFLYNNDMVYFKDITKVKEKKLPLGWKITLYHRNLIETLYLSTKNLSVLKENIISFEDI